MGGFLDAVWLPLVIALGVIALIYAIVYAGSARRGKRYRPGRPFEFTPVWFLAAPERQAVTAGDHKQLTGAADTAESRPHGPTGGASDRW